MTVNCQSVTSQKSNSSLIPGITGFEGIPQNLVVNLFVWLILMVVFIIVRKVYGYGRPAQDSPKGEGSPLIEEDSGRYSLFRMVYGSHPGDNINPGETKLVHVSSYAQELEVPPLPPDTKDEVDVNEAGGSVTERVSKTATGYLSWIPELLRFTDKDLEQKAGKDAVRYIVFERTLILYACIIFILSIAIILPINMASGDQGNSFARTTLTNVPRGSPLIWVALGLSMVYTAIFVLCMQHFFTKNKEELKPTTVLVISNVPLECSVEQITEHLETTFEGVHVNSVHFTYDSREYLSNCEKLREAIIARQYCQDMLRTKGRTVKVVPRRCGLCCGACCRCSACCHQVDGLEYYRDLELHYRVMVDRELASHRQRRLDVVFVVLENYMMQQQVLEAYRLCQWPTYKDDLSREIKASQWLVSEAPPAKDILWDNLGFTTLFWFRAVVVNVAVFFIAFFLSAPSMLLSLLNDVHFTSWLGNGFFKSILTEYLPTLILFFVTTLLPKVVFYSSLLVGHWFRSGMHYATMLKSFVYLIIMTLLLPSLGLNSIPALFSFILPHGNHSHTAAAPEAPFADRLRCVFLADNSAFFVNYVITATFTGNALEMLQIPQLAIYSLLTITARSKPELAAVRDNLVWEFQIGMKYAVMICVFVIICCYSVICPIITPFGLLYLVMTHLVDRYEVYFLYNVSFATWQLHELATHIALAGPFFLMVAITVYAALQSEGTVWSNPAFMVAFMALLLTCAGLIARAVYRGYRTLVGSYKEELVDQPSDMQQPDQPSDMRPPEEGVNQPSE